MSLRSVRCEASGEQGTPIISVPVGKYSLHHEDLLYSLFGRDVLGWKAGLSASASQQSPGCYNKGQL